MRPNKVQKAAFAITHWVGSAQSLIVHTIVFAIIIFILVKGLFPFDTVILVFNTAVSLEAIYLALFIQMTVNAQSQSIAAVEKDIDEMQEDVGEIQEDIDEIQEDVGELQEDVEEISEDVEEMSEEEEADERRKTDQKQLLADIHTNLTQLSKDIEKLQGDASASR